MRRTVIGVLAATMLLLAPRVVSAQAKSGDKEVLVAGNFFSLTSPDFTTSSGQMLFGVGYFLSDHLEFGVRPLITISSRTIPGQPAIPEVRIGNTVIVRGQPAIPSSTEVDVDGGVGTSVQYFFGASSSTVKPYVGAQLQVQSFKTKTGASFADNLFTQALFGVKNYFSERAALDFSGAYGFRPNAIGDFQLLTVQAGITVLF